MPGIEPARGEPSITEESGRPERADRTWVEAIEEPCTKSTMPRFRVPAAGGFCHRKSLIGSPFFPALLAQCSFPEIAGRAAGATSFTSTPLRKSEV
jgi:hypothetical protein